MLSEAIDVVLGLLYAAFPNQPSRRFYKSARKGYFKSRLTRTERHHEENPNSGKELDTDGDLYVSNVLNRTIVKTRLPTDGSQLGDEREGDGDTDGVSQGSHYSHGAYTNKRLFSKPDRH